MQYFSKQLTWKETKMPENFRVVGIITDKLTYDDVALLLEGLKALELKNAEVNLMGMVLSTMFSRSKEEAEQAQERHKREIENKKPEQQRLEEQIAVLRARLFLWRKKFDSSEADRVFEDTQ